MTRDNSHSRDGEYFSPSAKRQQKNENPNIVRHYIYLFIRIKNCNELPYEVTVSIQPSKKSNYKIFLMGVGTEGQDLLDDEFRLSNIKLLNRSEL